MAMRLLPRSEVNKAKALDRQREIDEGKKLATRVDTLRELAAEEDTNLSKFRDKMVAQIMADIKPLQEEHDGLVHKIGQRKLELVQLMQPINTLWDDVNKAQAINNGWEDDLTAREAQTAIAAGEVAKRRHDLEVDEARLADVKKNIDELAAESVRINTNAREFLAQARNDAQVLLSNSEGLQLDITRREELVAARERDAKIVEAKNKADAKDNRDTARSLKDKYDTLERTLTRLGIKQ